MEPSNSRTTHQSQADKRIDAEISDAATGEFRIQRYFSKPDKHPFDEIKWERRRAAITDENGEVIFEQSDVEVPASWTMLATNVVASKYFYGTQGTPEREYSVRQLVHRVARTLADWALEDRYIRTADDAECMYYELCHLLVNQYVAFNSPVWFNLGLYHVNKVAGSAGGYRYRPETRTVDRVIRSYEFPQCSACFIQSVDDNMEDIMRLATAEAMLFKWGSGTGTDLSTIRSSKERLSGGGRPSGPLSFMRVYDQIAAVVKSGGKTRRAAKMQSLKISHPDIAEFINAKREEEEKAWALIEQGYDGNYNGDAYGSVMFQNANFSVRAHDEFFEATESDDDMETFAVTSGEVVDRYKARDLLRMIANGTHICGDPGIQYESTINSWHTCPNSGAINASNPCSEYMFLDDSACNLASLNLMKFRTPTGEFEVESFQRAIRVITLCQEIIVDRASYPTELIAKNSHFYRPLGLGYANLGSLIMASGMPYDSDIGRNYAAAITAIMGGEAYAISAEIAGLKAPFRGYDINREPMLAVIARHRAAVDGIEADLVPDHLLTTARNSWDQALELGREHGFANAQVTVLAPTGTIGFMMDCDTTGVEPDIALVKYKLLAGGGTLKIVNRTVPQALQVLGYAPSNIEAIIDYIDAKNTIEGAPFLKDEDLTVFDCAFKATEGERFIHYSAHLKMMAAVQPYLSGAISKTVNVPHEITVDELMNIYSDAWRMGLKAVAIYRDGSKRSQPLSTSKIEASNDIEEDESQAVAPTVTPQRWKMPDTRHSLTHKFDIQGHEGYLTVGLYDDGKPGELFITMAKEGSTIGGLMDAFGTAVSMGLQYGVPLNVLVDKFIHSRFEPSGFTQNSDIPLAKSIVDYIFRWLALNFVEGFREGQAALQNFTNDTGGNLADDGDVETVKTGAVAKVEEIVGNGNGGIEEMKSSPASGATLTNSPGGDIDGNRKGERSDGFDEQFAHFQEDAPSCDVCGAITVRNGNCYRCYNCGNSMGCS
ncbi:MAG: vitamin B12-dependent ribonucleotide reductase [bacterium]|nr:vitamin B12-dependent ribonucleotide reductase [bacterium]